MNTGSGEAIDLGTDVKTLYGSFAKNREVKEPSIIDGTGAVIRSKTNFGPSGIALEVVPFLAYAPHRSQRFCHF
jgi:hypothetical protein